MASNMRDLPSDILLLIFSKLPITSVAKLRWVCKDWNALLSDPRSIRVLRPGAGTCNSSSCYMLVNKSHKTAYMLEHLNNNAEASKINVMPNIKKAITSCNDFVCYSTHHPYCEEMYVCNPVTGDRRKLPRLCEPYNIWAVNGDYSFGVDTITNEYKLVLLYSTFGSYSMPRCEGGGYFGLITYTLGTDSWRCKGPVHYTLCLDRSGVFCNGSLYWIAASSCNRVNQKTIILALDLHEEKFRELPYPEEGMTEGGGVPYLVKLGEELCLVRDSIGHSSVWVLEDEEKGKWCKKYSVVTNSDFKLLGLWKDGALLGKGRRGGLGCYDPKDGSYTMVELPDGFQFATGFSLHHPSLVSPKSLWTAKRHEASSSRH